MTILASAALGALAGLISSELGLRGVLGIKVYAPWILAWAAVAGLAAWRGHQHVVTVVASGSVLLLLTISSTPLVGAMTSRWIRADPIREPVDAVVVLSSDVKSDTLLDAGGTERLLSGIEVLRQTHAPRLVTTRVRSVHDGAALTTDAGQRRLISLAGADSGWKVVGDVVTTRDEAVDVSRLLLPASRRIAVVTSSVHTRRACATFEAVGFDVTCVPAREVVRVMRHPSSADDRLAAFRAYLYERLGMLKYEWSGWIRR